MVNAVLPIIEGSGRVPTWARDLDALFFSLRVPGYANVELRERAVRAAAESEDAYRAMLVAHAEGGAAALADLVLSLGGDEP